MSDSTSNTGGVMVSTQVTRKALAAACAQLILEYMPSDSKEGEIDKDEVYRAKQEIMQCAMDRDIPISQAATTILVKAFEGLLGDLSVRVRDDVPDLASLKLTQPLVEHAINTFAGDNHDETDTALTKAIREVIDLERGVGPQPGDVWAWATQLFGVGMSNAVGFANHISTMLEDHPDKKKKLMTALTKAAFSQAPAEVKEMM